MKDIKSKEEILDVVIPDASDNFDANYRDDVLTAMDEYAKQECIKFLKWLNDNKQDLSIVPMNEVELEEYYVEIMNDLQSKHK